MVKDSNIDVFFADLHIHIGATTTGKPVKITGSRTLTLSNILYHAKHNKGMQMVGVIDCHAPEVLSEIEDLMKNGTLLPLDDGGLSYEGLTLIPGTEIEINDENCRGPLHVLVYMPDIETMKALSLWLAKRVTNISLSTQRMYGSAKELQYTVRQLGGLFVPAHIFTPFKSLYGKGVKTSLDEVFDPDWIDAVELGLSSNTEMGSQIEELSRYVFLSNSDAHSLEKIGREYQMLGLNQPTFNELRLALQEKEGRGVIANYGLNPYLGKYYNTVCENCLLPYDYYNDQNCSGCGSKSYIKGVNDRIDELSSKKKEDRVRPPYIHQVPLEFIPGLGTKTLLKLRQAFGTDMDIIHAVPEEKLREVVKPRLAEAIIAARSGTLELEKGGGGTYGRVATDKPMNS